MFRFVWLAQDFINWGLSAPSATLSACMELAHLYAAEGTTVSMCFLN